MVNNSVTSHPQVRSYMHEGTTTINSGEPLDTTYHATQAYGAVALQVYWWYCTSSFASGIIFPHSAAGRFD